MIHTIHTRDESVQAAYASVFYAVCFIISVHYTFPFFVKENMTVSAGSIVVVFLSISSKHCLATACYFVLLLLLLLCLW